MVGGAIWGYCAIGRVESAITPTSVMTILITPAKIGRSMKKCGKFMALSPVDWSLSLRLLGWRGDGWRVCRRFLRNWLNRHTRLHQLQTRGNHFLALLQSALHNPLALEHGSSLEGAALDRIVGFHDERVFQALL